MKKLLFVVICLAYVPLLFADQVMVDADVRVTNTQPSPVLQSGSAQKTKLHRLPHTRSGSRDLLWNQAATQYNTLAACQWDSVFPFKPEICDNFVLAADATIDSVVWWGGYWPANPTPPLDFWIKIYPDSGAGLGPKQDPIYTERVSYVETLIDSVSGSHYYYYYEASIPPFNATAGVTYYIVFQPTLIIPPQYGCNVAEGLWGDGNQGYFKSIFLGFPNWTPAINVFGQQFETSFQLYGTAGGPSGVTWDFETGRQGWTHTSNQVFPAAWDVVSTSYPGGFYWNYYPPPNAGDSAFIIDSDSAGPAVWVVDTAMSPPVANPGFMFCKWGFLLQYDYLEVILREFTGSTWSSWTLIAYYTGNNGPQWDSANVYAYAGDSIQVAFVYDDNNTWRYGATFDNVSFFLPVAHDVGCTHVLSPPGPMAGPFDYDVIGNILNVGGTVETFDVTTNVYDTVGMTQIFTNTVTLTDFPMGGDSVVNFGTVTLVDGNTYYTEIYTELTGDLNPMNDSATQYTYCDTNYWEVLPNMPYRRSGAYAGYATINDTVYIHVFGGNPVPNRTTHDIYNTVTGIWSTGIQLPVPALYGGHCSIDNRIYMIGSFLAASNLFMVIYDAESDDYTQVLLPMPVSDPGIAVVDDIYIYIIGGGLNLGWNPSNTVQLYDVAGDSFFTGVTQLPNTIMAGAAGYLGNDTIIHVAGEQASHNPVNTTYLGYIHPENPAHITWTLGPDKPGVATYRLNGDAIMGTMFIAGGNPYTAATYAYESGTGWLTLPDKPEAHSNWGCAIAPGPGTPGEWIMYAAGGYIGPPMEYYDYFHALHTGFTIGIAEQPGEVPMAFGFRLLSSNPATERVQFQFDMPVQGAVNFSVYDVAGRRVVDSEFSSISAGTHTMMWDRIDDHGRKVANGIYFYRLEAAGNVATGKIILVQ